LLNLTTRSSINAHLRAALDALKDTLLANPLVRNSLPGLKRIAAAPQLSRDRGDIMQRALVES
jgi:hypothetical protein